MGTNPLLRPIPPALTDLMQRDPEARSYYRSLPPDTRAAVCSQKISTLSEMKAIAEPIIHAPYLG